MYKVIIHIFAAVGISYCLYRTAKKALNDPPEEERVYSSETAVLLDDEDGWDIEPPEGF